MPFRLLRDVRPMRAAFDRSYVKNIDADNHKGKISKRAMLEAIREDINRFREDKQVDRVVESLYSVEDPQFTRTVGALLGPPLVGGNRATVLLRKHALYLGGWEGGGGRDRFYVFQCSS